MKKALIFAAILFLFAGAALARPFIAGSLTLPNTLSFTVGFKSSGFSASLTDDDALASPGILNLSASWTGTYSWWDSALAFNLNDIDVVSAFPTPSIGGFDVSAKETFHVGTLLTPTEATDPIVLNFWFKTTLKYTTSSTLLHPTISFGFYWEP